jgi:hypothetical protein
MLLKRDSGDSVDTGDADHGLFVLI